MKVSFTKGQLTAALKTCPKYGGGRSGSTLHYVRVEAVKLVTCDGHRLSLVPIEGDAACDDAPRYIERSEAERIAKMMDAKARATLEWQTGEPIALTIDGRASGEVTDCEAIWPDYDRVIPSASPSLTIGFDANYLRDLCDAVISTNTGRVPVVAIDFTDGISPGKFRGDGVTVVLMPCRLDA